MGPAYKKIIILLPLLLVSIFMVLLYLPEDETQQTITGKVVDSLTKKPIRETIVTLDRDVVRTDGAGMFVTKGMVNKVAIRAQGYLRTELTIKTPLVSRPLQIELAPFRPKAVYLSIYGIGSGTLRRAALKLIEETEINALVIDVKGDRGLIGYKSSVPLASAVGAQKVRTVRDMKGLMRSLKEKGIYTIARIVVFKDNLLAMSQPDLAVRTPKGEIWIDRERLAWADPFNKKVWDYNIDIAVEAARYGFDEIQFDYVRFPDAGGLVFSMPNTEEGRVGAVSGFLGEAKRRLAPYNVFLAADIFGYASWNLNDTKIGQKLGPLAQDLEYLSPMLYPSGFQYGIPGFRNPVAHPHEIVYLSLEKARERTNLQPVRFRPWLQAFRDYAFDRRQFRGQEIRSQINAAEKFGSNGWMLWNSHNIYLRDGLKNKGAEGDANRPGPDRN